MPSRKKVRIGPIRKGAGGSKKKKNVTPHWNGFEAGEQNILLQAADVDASGEISYVAAESAKSNVPGTVTHSDQGQTTLTPNDDQSVDESEIQSNQSSERILQVVNQSLTHTQDTTRTNQTLPTGTAGQFFILTDGGKSKTESLVIDEGLVTDENIKQLVDSITHQVQVQMNAIGTSLFSESNLEQPSATEEADQSTCGDIEVGKPVKDQKKPDLTKPIEVTDHMEVVVNGKKCLLKVNPDTGQLCAYPLMSSASEQPHVYIDNAEEVIKQEEMEVVQEQETCKRVNTHENTNVDWTNQRETTNNQNVYLPIPSMPTIIKEMESDSKENTSDKSIVKKSNEKLKPRKYTRTKKPTPKIIPILEAYKKAMKKEMMKKKLQLYMNLKAEIQAEIEKATNSQSSSNVKESKFKQKNKVQSQSLQQQQHQQHSPHDSSSNHKAEGKDDTCSRSFVLTHSTDTMGDHSYSILSGFISANEASPEYMRKFDDIVCDFLREQGVPGASVFISLHGKPIYRQGYGIDCCGELTSSSTHFRIASISKVLTAIAVLSLCESGLLSLYQRVFGDAGILCEIRPDSITKMKQFEFITVENLLQHSAGWDRDVVGDHVFWFQEDKHKKHIDVWENESLVKYVMNFDLSFRRGSRLAYSNLGYLILGMVIEAVTGMKYEEFVKAIFRQLDIEDISIGKTKQEKVHYEEVKYYNNKDPAVEASVFGKAVMAPQYGAFPMENTGAYGGWVTCAENLVTILDSLIVKDGRPSALSVETVAKMLKAPSYAAEENWYGLGLEIEDNGLSFGHTGAMDGTSTTVYHDKSGLTWAFLLNSWAKDMDLDGVIKYALSTVQGLPLWSGVDLKYGREENFIMSADKFECVSILLPRKRLLEDVKNMKERGYVISWINAISFRNDDVEFNIVWQKQTDEQQWSVLIDIGCGDFDNCLKGLKGSWEVTALESYVVKDKLYHLLVFRECRDSVQEMYVVGSVIQHHVCKIKYESAGYQLQSQSAISIDDQMIISAVYNKLSGCISSSKLWIEVSAEDFVSRLAENIEEGLFLKYIQFYTTKGMPKISAVWHNISQGHEPCHKSDVFQRFDVTKYGFLFELGESLRCNRPVSFISAYKYEDVTYFMAVWKTSVRTAEKSK